MQEALRVQETLRAQLATSETKHASLEAEYMAACSAAETAEDYEKARLLKKEMASAQEDQKKLQTRLDAYRPFPSHAHTHTIATPHHHPHHHTTTTTTTTTAHTPRTQSRPGEATVPLAVLRHSKPCALLAHCGF